MSANNQSLIRIAVVMKTCQEEKLMGHLGVSFVHVVKLQIY